MRHLRGTHFNFVDCALRVFACRRVIHPPCTHSLQHVLHRLVCRKTRTSERKTLLNLRCCVLGRRYVVVPGTRGDHPAWDVQLHGLLVQGL